MNSGSLRLDCGDPSRPEPGLVRRGFGVPPSSPADPPPDEAQQRREQRDRRGEHQHDPECGGDRDAVQEVDPEREHSE
jgi:hypothetical protein